MKLTFWKKEQTGLTDATLQRNLVQKGFAEIEGTQHLGRRIDFTDEAIVSELNMRYELIQTIIRKKEKLSALDKEQLDKLMREWSLLNLFRAAKKSAMAWSLPGNDRDMSERWAALEALFWRNFENAVYASILRMALMHICNISYGEDWHVQPAPHIIVQQPIIASGYQAVNPEDVIQASKEQVTKNPH